MDIFAGTSANWIDHLYNALSNYINGLSCLSSLYLLLFIRCAIVCTVISSGPWAHTHEQMVSIGAEREMTGPIGV